MKSVLVISHIFPPNARAGAHRAYAMAKFLPRFGWRPVFLTAQVGAGSPRHRVDAELLEVFKSEDVIRVHDGAPFAGGSDTVVARATRRLYEWALPPDSRILWNRRLIKLLPKIIDRCRPEIAFMTAPPFSTLLLGRYIKDRYGLKIVLDYRDPWTNNPIAQNTLPRRFLNPFLDRRVLDSADLVTAASYEMADFIRDSVRPVADRTRFFGFPYGFDGAFFEKEVLDQRTGPSNGMICATFAGSVHGGLDVEAVLEGIRLTIDRHAVAERKLRIKCYGTLFGHARGHAQLISKYGLESHVQVHPFLPYRDFLEALNNSSFLILPLGEFPIAHVFYPTKMFDYLGVRRPILYIGGQGGLWNAIESCRAGLCTRVSPDLIAQSLISMVEKHDDRSCWYTDEPAYDRFERGQIYCDFATQLSNLLDEPRSPDQVRNPPAMTAAVN